MSDFFCVFSINLIYYTFIFWGVQPIKRKKTGGKQGENRSVKNAEKKACNSYGAMLIYNSVITEAVIQQGSMVKRLRHRPFTAVTRVRFPSGSFIIRTTEVLLRKE